MDGTASSYLLVHTLVYYFGICGVIVQHIFCRVVFGSSGTELLTNPAIISQAQTCVDFVSPNPKPFPHSGAQLVILLLFAFGVKMIAALCLDGQEADECVETMTTC